MVNKSPKRVEELVEWAESKAEGAEFLAHNLVFVRDPKRFISPTVIVEIPGAVDLTESRPYPDVNIDCDACDSVHSVESGMLF